MPCLHSAEKKLAGLRLKVRKCERNIILQESVVFMQARVISMIFYDILISVIL